MQPTTKLRQVIDLATGHRPATLTDAENALAFVRRAFGLPPASPVGADLEKHKTAFIGGLGAARFIFRTEMANTPPAVAAPSLARKPLVTATKKQPAKLAPSADRNVAARAALWTKYQAQPTGQARRDFYAKHKASLWQAAREVKV